MADVQRLWKDLHERADWAPYEVERNGFMADRVLADLRSHPEEKRNALFIVGVGHAMVNLAGPAVGPGGVLSAGSRLRAGLGADQVYAIFPHEPVQTNDGQVYGRIQRGLFGSAFAALGNRPVAFPLDTGPFGEMEFDALPDHHLSGAYRDGYSAYLFLGPLDDEVFSALIPGFYTDEFVQELERRTRIMDGKPWSEAYGLEPNAASFIAWMGGSWGKPRTAWTRGMGPLGAWREPRAAAAKPALRGTKEELMALVEDYFHHNAVDLTARKSILWGDPTKAADGSYAIAYRMYVTLGDREPQLFDATFTFSPTGELLDRRVDHVYGTQEALQALVELHLQQDGAGSPGARPVEWGEAVKGPDGGYSIRCRYRLATPEGGTEERNCLFTLTRGGDFVRASDVPGAP